MKVVMKMYNAAKYIQTVDPAARSPWEVILTYAGFHALGWYRISHWLYQHNWHLLAAIIANLGKFFTKVEIHPGAKIGHHVFIDHGYGTVIGETAVIGDYVTILHGVTLGSRRPSSKPGEPRHPQIGSHVFIGAHAQLLGNVHVGDYAKVGAAAVVLHDVPAYRTVVGNPGHLI